VFGLLVVFQPFANAPPLPATVSGTPAATALQQRIETARVALRDTETALHAAKGSASTASPQTASVAQYEAQIAAAIERRHLALRHAEAIRRSLDAGLTPSSQAEIRDSVVIGQLLAQQAALDARLATEGARLRASHPTMRALSAQRTALVTQIRQEAASIATALEAEARIDDAQIKLLEGQLPELAATPVAVDTSALQTRAAAQRAELDGLVDAYFNIPSAATATTPAASPANPLSLANLAIVAVATMAAIVFQFLLAARRRRIKERANFAKWRQDQDTDMAAVVASTTTLTSETVRKAA
jgi:uncharacterized protein involved in exopolysaccharide biosynthesis